MSSSPKAPIDLLSIPPCSIHIQREIAHSDASSIFEIELDSTLYAMKLYHDNGDPGYTEKGRDLNRFRCELNAYRNLSSSGVCEKGHVPRYHGYIDHLDPTHFNPHLDHFLDSLCTQSDSPRVLPQRRASELRKLLETWLPGGD